MSRPGVQFGVLLCEMVPDFGRVVRSRSSLSVLTTALLRSVIHAIVHVVLSRPVIPIWPISSQQSIFHPFDALFLSRPTETCHTIYDKKQASKT